MERKGILQGTEDYSEITKRLSQFTLGWGARPQSIAYSNSEEVPT
jgi:hypothetical protein